MSFRSFITILLLSIQFFAFDIHAQNWTFVKEKNGIQIYERKEAGNSINFCKGIANINAPADKVYSLIENVHNTDWWVKNISKLKILYYKKDVEARYYLVYDLPWPIEDRDLCVKLNIVTDSANTRKIIATPLKGVIPIKPGLVRIKNYKQTWTIKPINSNLTHIEMECYVDPGGDIPDWIVNLIMTNSPFTEINNLRHELEKKKLP